ncbi:MAG: 4-(cytidine 5'-diphospho)-2-C-methyl-D-erythritol kinase [Fusobacteriaceae bacterium]|nr:4-(cytidine 5'-diphospho)-2-C-methyl-D-erythritol kinase [Fusobacteriaceae bacterium]MBN2838920.1 4-(cytidine 5'-diphospho)-2-C-methyl-D-erythritol kinase [Fusobacteriaceae bacterium]
MIEYIVKANAKINLGLNILGKTENGYHELDMIMAPINLFDTLNIKFFEKKGNLEIKSNNRYVPLNENNIIYKVYEAFYISTSLQRENIEVYLDKVIPSQAGLGGGSSDGAFFLKTLNTYHNFPLSEKEMIDLGKKIGADIPFFINNKVSRAKGIGEKLEEVENNLEAKVILIKPKVGISTAEAFKNFSKLEEKKWADIEKVIEGLKENNLEKVIENIHNHLQQTNLLLNNEIKTFEEKLIKISKNFKMSGSGSCYYLISDKENSQNLYKKLRGEFEDCFISLNDFI